MKRIILAKVWKKFRIGRRRDGALARLISFFSGKEYKKTIWALKDISLEIKAGETVGIIGKNGSGKSTLLRVIAGIYKHDKGEVKTKGNMVPLINLNVGLQARLSMKDNINLCCSLFGLPKKKIKERFHSIVEFSELGRFLDTKIYQFSEGMKQRLGFSIAINCNPEILLLDEVFEIGDKNFKIKSAEKIKELAKNGASVILVSHEVEMVKKYCSRVIWLERGRIIRDGETKGILIEYQKSRNGFI